jgi:hypothetical protein
VPAGAVHGIEKLANKWKKRKRKEGGRMREDEGRGMKEEGGRMREKLKRECLMTRLWNEERIQVRNGIEGEP